MDAPASKHHPEPKAAWVSGVRLGSLFGLDVIVHWRVPVLIAAAILLATPLSPVDVPGWLGITSIEFVVLGVPMMVGSIFAHELGHAVAAQALGLGARSVFVDVLKGHTIPKRPASRARDEAAVCLAGPFVNLVFWFVLGRLSGDLYAPLFTSGSAMAVTASFNLLLVLNFAPALPFDGGRAFAALMWGATGDRARGTRIVAAIGPFLVGGAVLAVAAYVAFIRNDPWWGVVIAGSLIFELRGLVGHEFDASDRVAHLRVSDIMCPGLRTTPGTLARVVVQDRVGRKHSPDLTRIAALDLPYVAITDGGEVLGLLSPGDVDHLALRHLRWDTVTMAEVMTPVAALVTVTPELPLQTAHVYMYERQLEVLLVVDDGEPVGCITAKRLNEALAGEPRDVRASTWTPNAQGAELAPAGDFASLDPTEPADRTTAA